MNAPSSYLIIGESVTDIVRTPEGRQSEHPGGSPANVAYGLGRLGNAVRFVTELGPDNHGALVRAHLTSAGVDVRASTVDRTPTATATLDPSGAAAYEFDIAWTLRDGALEAGTTHVHSGSIAAYQLPGADTVERILTAARGHATISFDPNIRPLLLDDRSDARHRTDRLVNLSDVVKASDEDLRWLYPNRNPVDVAQNWLEQGPAIIVVTRGEDGAVVTSRAGTITIPPIRVTVADTVGAGDSFMAAMLDGLAGAGFLGGSRRTLLASADLGTVGRLCARAARAAAITVSRHGANPPSREDLDGGVVPPL